MQCRSIKEGICQIIKHNKKILVHIKRINFKEGMGGIQKIYILGMIIFKMVSFRMDRIQLSMWQNGIREIR